MSDRPRTLNETLAILGDPYNVPDPDPIDALEQIARTIDQNPGPIDSNDADRLASMLAGIAETLTDEQE